MRPAATGARNKVRVAAGANCNSPPRRRPADTSARRLRGVRCRSRGGLLQFAPAATLTLFLAPVAAGLIGTALPAFGYLPALGGESFGLAACLLRALKGMATKWVLPIVPPSRTNTRALSGRRPFRIREAASEG